VGYRITIAEAPVWASKLQGKLHAAALKGLLSAAHRLVGVIQTEIIPKEARVPVDRGIYKAAWRADKTPEGARVSNSSPHAGLIEDGVRAASVKPGREMIEALTAWVLRKGIVSRAGASSIARNASRVQAESVAWAIARSMQQRGIFNRGGGLGILRKARVLAPNIIKEEVAREVAADKGKR